MSENPPNENAKRHSLRRLFENFGVGDYDRPNLPWVCGQSEAGCPSCPTGPTSKGTCPKVAECTPVRDGNRWVCDRPAERGGSCDNDPLGGGPSADGVCCRQHSCRPQRNTRRRRGRLAVGSAVFAAGALMMFIGSGWRSELLAPGKLSLAHAQLIGREHWQNRCSACHPGGASAKTLIGMGSTEAIDEAHATQSDLCIKCHENLIPRDHAFAAHGLPASKLPRKQRVDAQVVQAGLASGIADLLPLGPGEVVACSACHQEHQGTDHDLTAISDSRCQACHAERYHSFASDHPEFGLWPFERSTRIAFDHASHAGKHFASKNESFDCATCHIDSSDGSSKLLAGYEQACSRCHDAGIATSTREGLAVIALPMLDDRALQDAGVKLGPWPAAAMGDFDGDLPAITKLLLSADPKSSAAIDRLGANFSFFDLDPDSDADARDAATLAEGMRKLVSEIATNGHEAILQRASHIHPAADRRQSIAPNLTMGLKTGLATGLPIDMLARIQQTWFGRSQANPDSSGAIQQASLHASGGWFVDDATLSLRYKPSGHGDPFLKSWITLAASLGDEHRDLREAALAELASANSTGQCASCHSIEQTSLGTLTVNWHALDPRDKPRQFTRFTHRPHLAQPELADCAHCHKISQQSPTSLASYSSRKPTQFTSQFEPISKSACVECHQPKAAGGACTQCHNYHVELDKR